MNSYVLWYSYRWVISSPHIEWIKGEQLQLMITPDYDGLMKHSYIHNPNKDKIVYGDKEVVHRVMTWFVEPRFISKPYYDWTYSTEKSDGSGSNYYYLSESGSSSINGVARYSLIEKAPNPYGYWPWRRCTEYRAELFCRPSDIYPGRTDIIRRWNRTVNQEGDEPLPWPGTWNESVVGWYYTKNEIHTLECGNGAYRSDFEIDVDRHVPSYDWMGFMDSKRPWTDNDTAALSEVIRNTIQEETTVDTNNFANLSEIIDLCNDFRKGKVGELIEDTKEFFSLVKKTYGHSFKGKAARTLLKKTEKGVADGWLKYRYAYKTTKSDVEQFVRAQVNDYLGTVRDDRVFRGTIGITNGVLHVKFRMHDNPAPNFDRLLINMNQRGFFPGLYNLWDMIPFSFVADWFSNFGDYLQDIDQSIFFRYYKVDELCVSYKQSLMLDERWGPTLYRWYDRELLDDWPQWELYDDSGPSGKVVTYRALDSASLVVGVT